VKLFLNARAALKPTGMLAIGEWAPTGERSGEYATSDQIAAQMSAAGFQLVRIDPLLRASGMNLYIFRRASAQPRAEAHREAGSRSANATVAACFAESADAHALRLSGVSFVIRRSGICPRATRMVSGATTPVCRIGVRPAFTRAKSDLDTLGTGRPSYRTWSPSTACGSSPVLPA